MRVIYRLASARRADPNCINVVSMLLMLLPSLLRTGGRLPHNSARSHRSGAPNAARVLLRCQSSTKQHYDTWQHGIIMGPGFLSKLCLQHAANGRWDSKRMCDSYS